jgi:DNA polymerase-3 subunit beta
MRISCTKDNLMGGISVVSNIATRGGNLPILSNILLKTDEDGLVLCATNLELGARAKVRAKIEEHGEYTLPAKLLADYVSVLPDEKIDLVITGDGAEVICGKSATKMKGMPSSEFPLLPDVEGSLVVQFDLPLLLEAVGSVLFTVAPGEVRPEISGVLFTYDAEAKVMKLVGTDSYRLAEVQVPCTVTSEGAVASMIVPVKTLHEFVRIFHQKKGADTTATLVISPNQVTFQGSGVELISRLVDGQYPDYTQIIPKETKTSVMVVKKDFVQAIKAASLFSKTGVNDVHLSVDPENNVVKIDSGNTQFGNYATSVPAEIKGEETKITFNYRYLLEGINSLMATDVEFRIVDGANPCILAPKGNTRHLYIIMPIKQD